jgi:hypothetical protein
MPRHKLGPGPGRPKGVQNKATVEHKEFLRGILESQEYRDSLTRRLIRGDPGLETLAHHYVLGKPKDTLSLEGTSPLLAVDALSESDIEAIRASRKS